MFCHYPGGSWWVTKTLCTQKEANAFSLWNNNLGYQGILELSFEFRSGVLNFEFRISLLGFRTFDSKIWKWAKNTSLAWGLGDTIQLFLIIRIGIVHVPRCKCMIHFWLAYGEPIQSRGVRHPPPPSSSVSRARFVTVGAIDPKLLCTYVPLGKSNSHAKVRSSLLLGLATRGPKPKTQKCYYSWTNGWIISKFLS
jgi:hypothetical protein